MTTIALATTSTSAFFEQAFEALVVHLRTHRARRNQRLALRTLLELDPTRLADLGISPSDILDATRTR